MLKETAAHSNTYMTHTDAHMQKMDTSNPFIHHLSCISSYSLKTNLLILFLNSHSYANDTKFRECMWKNLTGLQKAKS